MLLENGSNDFVGNLMVDANHIEAHNAPTGALMFQLSIAAVCLLAPAPHIHVARVTVATPQDGATALLIERAGHSYG